MSRLTSYNLSKHHLLRELALPQTGTERDALLLYIHITVVRNSIENGHSYPLAAFYQFNKVQNAAQS